MQQHEWRQKVASKFSLTFEFEKSKLNYLHKKKPESKLIPAL
jgi:hypothetical protein